jgi:abhydrolase domain-containing protein 6
MQSEQEQTNNPAGEDAGTEAESQRRIRRGKGLQLSVHDADTRDPEPPPSASPTTRRGKGMQLSVQSEADEPSMQAPPPAPAADEVQPQPADEIAPVSPAVPSVAPSRPERPGAPAIRLACRQAGQRAPLVLLHGWSNSSILWEAPMQGLGELRHSFALDLPGFGETRAPNGMPDIATLAEAVLDFADSRDLERFDLAGHSFGALIAARIAATYPERVGRLVLTALGVESQAVQRPAFMPAFMMARSSFEWSFELMRPWLLVWRPWAQVFAQYPPLPQFMAFWLVQRRPDEQRWREIVGDMAAADPRGFLAYRTGISDPALGELLQAIRVPTLLLSGRDDRVCRSETVTAAQQLLRDSRLHLIDNCGHLPMVEQPAAYTQALHDFLGTGGGDS